MCSLDASASDYIYEYQEILEMGYYYCETGWSSVSSNSSTSVLMGNTYIDTYTPIYWEMQFRRNDGLPLIEKGTGADVTIKGFYPYVKLSEEYNFFWLTPDVIGMNFHYKDGSVAYVTPDLKSIDDEFNSVTFKDFIATDDVVMISYYYSYKAGQMWTSALGNRDFTMGHNVRGDLFSIDIESEEVSVLKKVDANIKEGFANLKKGIENLGQSILDGIKNFFIPSQGKLIEFKENFDELLAHRFGAIYQSFDLIIEMWDEVRYSDTQNTIDMPLVTIPVGSGESFSFGGFGVKVVPDGFGFLAESIKMITSVLCTLLFINGMRKRYDEVMTGGNVA